MDNSVKITLIVVSAVVILALVGGFMVSNYGPNPSRTITVSGESNIKAVPDLVGVYFSIETNGSTSQEATAANSKIVDELKTALIKQGFSRANITTESFNVYPDYVWDKNTQTQYQKGYKAVHQLKVSMGTSDTRLVGEAVDAGVAAGAGISYINFELSIEKQNSYKAEAMKLAAQDARVKAESMAAGLDKKVGSIVSISNSDYSYRPWELYSAGSADAATNAAMAKEASTNIQPSAQDINARVNVVYRIN